MKMNQLFKFTIVAVAFFVLALMTAASLNAQVSWDRQAYGQGPFYPPGHDGDPNYAYYYPNNNNWSQVLTFATDAQGHPLYEIAPSNWSTDSYPTGDSVDVTLGNTGLGANNAPTNLDRGVRTGNSGGLIVLNSLTIESVGGLNMEAGTALTLNLLNLQGNNSNDANITNNGGGGAFPIITLPAGGTIKKTTGTSTFTIDPTIGIRMNNGGTIAADAGALQLPSNNSTYAGGVNFNAATGALVDLAPADAVDSNVVLLSGTITGINTGGTVRLNKGWLASIGGSGGFTFNFGGNTFQWQGGAIRSTTADPFINAGTINITGTPSLGSVGFTNQGTIIQSGAGELNLPAGTGFTNAAGSVYDIRNDLGLTVNGGGGANPFFTNAGTLLKSAGSGPSIVDGNLVFNNTGTIAVQSGTLQLGASGTFIGATFNVSSGATLNLIANNGAVRFNGNFTGTGGGTVLLDKGTLDARDTGATFNFGGSMFQWSGGTIVSTTAAPFINAGTINITGTPSLGSVGFTNQGTIIQSGAGELNLPAGTGFTNAGSGIYDIRNDLGLTVNGGGGANPFFTNAGTLSKSAGTGTSTIGVAVYNSGIIACSSGTLSLTNLTQVSAGQYLALDGTLSLNIGPIVTNGASVILSGQNSVFGPIDSIRENDAVFEVTNSRNFSVPALQAAQKAAYALATSNAFTNVGTLIVGPNSSLTVNGDYAQGSGSSLDIVISGNNPNANFHQLNITGTASLAGTLDVALANGYVPAADQTFEIINAGAINGGFVTVIGATVTYTSTGAFIHPTGNAIVALQLSKAVSRKTHGNGGTFDVDLPLTGGPGVECRGSAGNHTLVFTFTNNVVSGTAGVTGGTASVSGSPTFTGKTMTVNLTGVANMQTITLTLSNVTDTFLQVLPNTSVTMGVLLGDVNGDGGLSNLDVSLVRAKVAAGAAVDSSNFRDDVNADGGFSNLDISLTKAQVAAGAKLPTPP